MGVMLDNRALAIATGVSVFMSTVLINVCDWFCLVFAIINLASLFSIIGSLSWFFTD